ncbi:SET domain and Post-SET domain-containing protein [Strongyloides ratti]|uniref:SET domain and Post-SET domain-containing protein n=1 Tax=Strongyloides ratti TaxID=34506 RepID=A0A090L3Q3_STRRB|nr:SET domain and Post-SET domain-containing protein [Strongyloides ratti]CEF62697.1 SET domain and Post-SET domain-containing protein [Strongyloides ratti]
MASKRKKSGTSFQRYYNDTFLEMFKIVDESKVLFIIGINKEKTKFLVMTDDYSDDKTLKEYIGVWEAIGILSESMVKKIKKLNDRHIIIDSLKKQNPDIPFRMNPFAPTDWNEFKTLVRCMHLTWAYHLETYKDDFRGNELFIINYLDNECPSFIFSNKCLFDKYTKLTNISCFNGCNDCQSTSYSTGCSEVKQWYDTTLRWLVGDKKFPPVLECCNKCSCYRRKEICKNRISLTNRDSIPLIIFKTVKKGWALGAGRNMKAGEVVTEYTGIVFNHLQIKKGSDATYTFELDYIRKELEIEYDTIFKEKDGYYVIDSKQIGNESRFACHSCDPNMDVVASYGVYKSPTIHKLFYCMKKDVLIGTELTINYFYNLVENKDKNMLKCECGSKNCMKTLPTK